jgi:AcrR family transcriptional regulator
MSSPEVGTLTKSQAARRERVIRSALELAGEGGYDAVQMRDVATRANVALGTIYRYFSSKDALLAAALVEWMGELERKLLERPPKGTRPSERVLDVLNRALRAMDRNPRLARAVVGALMAGDPAGVDAMNITTGTMSRIMRPAFPPDIDPALEASVTKVLGHVWWSTLVAWVTGMGDIAWVSDELAVAVDLLVSPFD